MIIFIYALEHVITSVPETKFHFLLYGMCDIISKNMFHIIIYIINLQCNYFANFTVQLLFEFHCFPKTVKIVITLLR